MADASISAAEPPSPSRSSRPMSTRGRPPRTPSARRKPWSSAWTASRARSTCCWRWRARRRWTSPRSPSWHLADQYLAFIAAGPEAASRACRRLPGDGGLARLPEVASCCCRARPAPRTSRRGDELAARLAFRLKRLEAMRNAAATLMTRKRLGRDIFARGMPEGVRTIRVRAVYRRHLRPAQGLRRAAPPHHQARARHPAAHGVVHQGGAPASGGAGRPI